MALEGAQKLGFTIPLMEPLPPQYYIRLVSDNWMQVGLLVFVCFCLLLFVLGVVFGLCPSISRHTRWGHVIDGPRMLSIDTPPTLASVLALLELLYLYTHTFFQYHTHALRLRASWRCRCQASSCRPVGHLTPSCWTWTLYLWRL